MGNRVCWGRRRGATPSYPWTKMRRQRINEVDTTLGPIQGEEAPRNGRHVMCGKVEGRSSHEEPKP
eukprot:scaffold659_cov318-Pavlova_lutheri.AAC.17